MKKRRIIILFIIILLTVLSIFIYKKYSSQEQIKVLNTVRVERGNIRAVLVETGIIKLRVGAQIKIGARATGEIVKMNVVVGSCVKKDEIIAIIDDREILKMIDQTKAEIMSKKYRLTQVTETYPELIKEAAANFKYASIDYKRETELKRQEYTTQVAVDRAKAAYDSTGAILKRLKDEFRLEKKIINADLKKLAGLLEQQKIKLSYTKIIAPINGIVSDITAQKGETIVTGLQVANLVTIIIPSNLEMWIYVDETDIGHVKIGQFVEFRVDTYQDKTFAGNIEKIYPQPVVKDNITYYLAIVNITRDNAMFFKPEMTTYAKIIYDNKHNILTVPNEAIKFAKGRCFAYTFTDKKEVEKNYLELGISGEEKTEIISGVKEGDILITKMIIPKFGKQKD